MMIVMMEIKFKVATEEREGMKMEAAGGVQQWI